MRSCAKCAWLGIMGPCPHEGEPFPIYTRSHPARRRVVLDVVEHIELGVMDDSDEEAADFGEAAEAAPSDE